MFMHEPMLLRIWMVVCVLALPGIGLAADGVPEVSREVRAKVATGQLKSKEQVALLYVKGMT